METFNNILQELEELSPTIARIPKINVWAVPAGYFDTILPAIMKIIKDDPQTELENLSPLISSLSKKNIFTVPDDYFNKKPFDAKIFRNEAKIIALNSKRKRKQIWLAAASIIILIGLSITWWKISNPSIHTPITNERNLTVNIENIDDSSLQNYISSNSQINDLVTLNTTANDNIDINEEINYINDKEINQYVVENQYLALK